MTTPLIDRAQAIAAQFRSHPASRGIDDIEAAGEVLYELIADAERLRAQVAGWQRALDAASALLSTFAACGMTHEYDDGTPTANATMCLQTTRELDAIIEALPAAPAQQAAPEQTSGSSAAAPVVGPSLTVGERERFEAWMKTLPGYPYAGKFADRMWQGWQARAAEPAAQAEPVAWSKTVESAALLLNRCTQLPLDDCEGLAGTILGMAQQSHPPAQGVGDERAAFDAWWARYYGTEPMLVGWKVWQARAAIAQAPAAQGAHGPNDFNAVMLAQSASVTAQYTRAAQAPAIVDAAVDVGRDGGDPRRVPVYRTQAPAAEPQWQPIETAPRDGAAILAFWKPVSGSQESHCYGITEFVEGRWRNPEEDDDYYIDPTHWMPLPAAPAT